MVAMRTLLAALLPAGIAASDIVLATFDGAKETTHTWKQMNDPVMGGKSTGTFTIANGVGVFDGVCALIPSLKAPGFIKASVTDFHPFGRIFPDVSSCDALVLTVNSKTDYAGYRFSIGSGHAPGGKFFAYGYKAHFVAPVGKFGTVEIPFTNFTDFWDDATGNAIKTCQDDKVYCPNTKTLQDMRTMSVWAEGVEGNVHLELKSVAATGCKAAETEKILV